ncbi:BZ3500_MvSof-1268-A1-R1_Chr10-2g02824 [Microbotryum saponariae]|uniref:BZ3500_MvSof-1268-A1-R1_Chr10-2g02824 protein n=1 Tax=Microbotryum saponariae TaxID=289078 RepID=A0A2X0L4S3_9BASI|nr:BZ3500_MvSof-1268-A1-R1_Chr10-2g02824 [Microbotryum saponariae]
MTTVVRNLDLVAPDRPDHQHSTMVDKFPLVSAVQHSPSPSLDGPLGVRSCSFALRSPSRSATLAPPRCARSASRHLDLGVPCDVDLPRRNDPARAASRILSDPRSQLKKTEGRMALSTQTQAPQHESPCRLARKIRNATSSYQRVFI